MLHNSNQEKNLASHGFCFFPCENHVLDELTTAETVMNPERPQKPKADAIHL